MQHFSIAPKEMIASTLRNRNLIFTLVKRDVVGRYRGSFLGLAWSFFNPLLMLSIYTFVFSVAFKARWGVDGDESKADFALLLFVGLIVHGLFAECVNRAPSLILSNVNYVKKVIFPLEVLPLVAFGAALFHAIIGLVVMLFAQLILNQTMPWTILLFPFAMLPLVFFTMGFSWFLAGIGVFIRDIGQVTSMFTTILLFMSGVFFPINALPLEYQLWLRLNPLVFFIEAGRSVLILGEIPELGRWGIMLVASFLVAWAGFAWFQKTRKGFADVL